MAVVVTGVPDAPLHVRTMRDEEAPLMMLAQRGSVDDIERLQGTGYLFDLKIDGVRCLVEVDEGTVRLSSRTGTPMEHRYPEVVSALLEAYPTGRVVLDGEIAVDGPEGLPSWPLTHKRDAQQSGLKQWVIRLPAVFYAFDVLEYAGKDLRFEPFGRRRLQLDQMAPSWNRDHLRPVLHSNDGLALWALVTTHHLEGMVAKRSASPYRVGKRTQDWVKVKNVSTTTCLVGGSDPGEGSRASTFGALHLYLLDEEHLLVPVGKVGSGFSDRELVDVAARLGSPPLIVEVEHLGVSPDGQLRQAIFQRVRTDVTLLDCTMEQLIEIAP